MQTSGLTKAIVFSYIVGKGLGEENNHYHMIVNKTTLFTKKKKKTTLISAFFGSINTSPTTMSTQK